LEKLDAAGDCVFAGVGCGDGEGFRGDVEGGDLGIGKVNGESDRDGSGAGADVGDLQRLVCRQELQDGFDEVLGLRARDEDGRGDVESEAIELLLACDVLDGLVAESAGDAAFVEGLLVRGELVVGVSDESSSGDLESVEEKKFSVACGCGAEMRVGGELGEGSGNSLAEGHAGGYLDGG
jgi:hypothetical protein